MSPPATLTPQGQATPAHSRGRQGRVPWGSHPCRHMVCDATHCTTVKGNHPRRGQPGDGVRDTTASGSLPPTRLGPDMSACRDPAPHPLSPCPPLPSQDHCCPLRSGHRRGQGSETMGGTGKLEKKGPHDEFCSMTFSESSPRPNSAQPAHITHPLSPRKSSVTPGVAWAPLQCRLGPGAVSRHIHPRVSSG